MILDKFRLDGKVAVVTGAARGLGQGMALGLAEAGADIVLVDLLDLTDSRSRVEALGRRCTAVTADLSHEESMARIVSAAQSSMGSIDILVNNAGIIRRQPLLEFSEKNWDDVLQINLRASFFSARRQRR